MVSYRARVINGRLKLDEPTDLPEGEVVDLFTSELNDDVDHLGDTEREHLRATIHRGLEDGRAGRTHSLKEVLRAMGKPG